MLLHKNRSTIQQGLILLITILWQQFDPNRGWKHIQIEKDNWESVG